MHSWWDALPAPPGAGRFDAAAAAYRLAPDVTASRLYLETVEQVLPGKNKLIVDKTTTNVSSTSYRMASNCRMAFGLCPE